MTVLGLLAAFVAGVVIAVQSDSAEIGLFSGIGIAFVLQRLHSLSRAVAVLRAQVAELQRARTEASPDIAMPAEPQSVPPEAAPAPKPPAPPEPPEPAVTEAQPVQINLAAGMAIDVDGTLDLKGHGRNDAEERLKERILDGHALGWRTLHVVLGPAEDLRSMFLDLVARSGRIARYAQAPIPMGGSQAWIVYFRGPGTPPEGN